MLSHALVVVLAVVAVAQPPGRRLATPTAKASAARSKTPPPAFVDSAAVRRMCEQPDSVLAGRRACVLRDQAPRIRKF